MRKAWWIAAMGLSIALVLPALAQQPAGQPDANQFFTGANPRNITFNKVDPTKAMRGSSVSKAMQPATASQRSMTPRGIGLFPRVTLGTWPPKLPSFSSVKTPTTPPVSKVSSSSVNLFNNAK